MIHKAVIQLDRVANVKNQPLNFQQLTPCAWRAHWCLNNRTLKLHFQAYIASELHQNCFTWLRVKAQVISSWWCDAN